MSDGTNRELTLRDAAPVDHSTPSAALPTPSRTALAELLRYTFKGDTLDVVRDGEDVFVGVRSVCDALGISVPSQMEKLQADPSATLRMIVTVAADGKSRGMSFLAVRHLPLWLATIHPTKVSPDVRSKLIAYRKEAADALADHFLGKRGTLGRVVAPGFRVEKIVVTPAMASEWLSRRNATNRPLRDRLVQRFAADMKRGAWKTTHQGIAFGPSGELIDGQQRLKAIVTAGVAIELLVTYYETAEAAAEAKLTCDTGRSRSTGDAFALVGLTSRGDGDRVAAIVKCMCTIEGHRTDTLSPDEVKARYEVEKASIDWSLSTLASHDFSALHRAAFAYAFSACPEPIARFADAVKNVDAPAGTPASTYLKLFLRTSGSIKHRREVMLKILRLLKAHVCDEKGLARLSVSTESVDFFRMRRFACKALEANSSPT